MDKIKEVIKEVSISKGEAKETIKKIQYIINQMQVLEKEFKLELEIGK